MGWIVNGKEVSNEEHAEYVKQREEEKQRTQDEIQRRINEVGEAFRACKEFIEQHPEVHYELKDAQMREHDLYRKLRQKPAARRHGLDGYAGHQRTVTA